MGLYDELRPGAPRSIDDERIAELIRTTLKSKPKDGTHWTCRSIAEETKLSKSTVQRLWKAFSVQPHRQKHFKLSTDPFFVEKVRDIVGLYLDPPDNAVVFCVDEKSQIQALDRTQRLLPMHMDFPEARTHDYVRYGTTSLFAALNTATGEVIGECYKRHRSREFLRFLKTIDETVPSDLDVHLILDNYATHKTPSVQQWLSKRPRFHVHFTPTYSSWLNLVERWFALLSERKIKRASHRSTRQLERDIRAFLNDNNEEPKPFIWTKSADEGGGEKDVTGYGILRSTLRDAGYGSIATVLAGTADYVDTSAEDGVTYYYRVAAEDGEFSIDTAECLGLCEQAPCILVDDKRFGDVTPEMVSQIIEEVRG